ncbi:MAG: hypothetical protein AAF557_14440 [Pseudomonadota bacterium]
MTDANTIQAPLGVGAILSDCMGLVFGNLGTLLPITLIPSVISIALSYILVGPTSLNATLFFTDPAAAAAAQANTSWLTQVTIIVMNIVLWGFITTSITKAVYDIKQNGSASVGDAVSTGVRYMLPVLPIVLISAVAFYLGFILLIVPGLYLMAMWFVIVPCFIVEKQGFGSWRRSAQLSEGYRWPAVGLIILFVLVYLVIVVISGFLFQPRSSQP